MIGLSWAVVAVLVVAWLFGYLIVGYAAPWFVGLLVVAALLAIFNLFFAGRTIS